MELLRVKGVLAIQGKANRVVLQAVRELYDKVFGYLYNEHAWTYDMLE
jgi:G3E family GTPase